MHLKRAAGLLRKVSVISLGMTLIACGGMPEETAELRLPTVYGADDRQEYFEIDSSAEQQIAAGAMVALVSNRILKANHDQLNLAGAWGTVDNLCPGERFFDQPSVAFCSGVLVDWDLDSRLVTVREPSRFKTSALCSTSTTSPRASSPIPQQARSPFRR